MSTKEKENTVGQNMQRLREARGWSKNELAKRLAQAGLKTYTATVVGRTENGERIMRLDEAMQVAKILGTNITKLTQSPEPQKRVSEWDIREMSKLFEQQYREALETLFPYIIHYKALADDLAQYEGPLKGRTERLLEDRSPWTLLCDAVDESSRELLDLEDPILSQGLEAVTTEVTGLRPDLHLPPEKTH